LEAKLVGSDHADAAILKIGPEHLTAIPFGDSDKLRVGDFVVAIGDPALGGLTVTSGIVGSLHYRALENQRPASFIRSDARSNAGYSGGALVTLRGELD
jgi:S1-C subfamily serine protease